MGKLRRSSRGFGRGQRIVLVAAAKCRQIHEFHFTRSCFGGATGLLYDADRHLAAKRRQNVAQGASRGSDYERSVFHVYQKKAAGGRCGSRRERERASRIRGRSEGFKYLCPPAETFPPDCAPCGAGIRCRERCRQIRRPGVPMPKAQNPAEILPHVCFSTSCSRPRSGSTAANEVKSCSPTIKAGYLLHLIFVQRVGIMPDIARQKGRAYGTPIHSIAIGFGARRLARMEFRRRLGGLQDADRCRQNIVQRD